MLEQLYVIISYLIIASVAGFNAAMFARLWHYALGNPSAPNPNPRALFFQLVTLPLAKKALPSNIIDTIEKSPVSDIKKSIQIAAQARDYYTWHNALGMCVVCNSFWVALIMAMVWLPTVAVIYVNHGQGWHLWLILPYFLTVVSTAYYLISYK